MTITHLFNRILEEIALVLFLACPISISIMVHDKFLMLFAYYLSDLLSNSSGRSLGRWQSLESYWLSLLWKDIILCELWFTLWKIMLCQTQDTFVLYNVCFARKSKQHSSASILTASLLKCSRRSFNGTYNAAKSSWYYKHLQFQKNLLLRGTCSIMTVWVHV